MGEDEAWTLLSWEADLSVVRTKLASPAFSEEQVTHLLSVAQIAAEGQPLAYAYGRVPFAGRWFSVSKDVLIPRQETEELVEHALQYAGPEAILVDCGSGSGCIPVTCALDGAWKAVYGCDISTAALKVAEHNVQNLGASVLLQHLDVTSSAWTSWCRETIGDARVVFTANLPYIPDTGMHDLDALVQQEPSLALDGGCHGTEIIKAWLERVWEAQLHHPVMLLELDEDNAEDLNAFCAEKGWSITWRRDAAGLLRFCDITFPGASGA